MPTNLHEEIKNMTETRNQRRKKNLITSKTEDYPPRDETAEKSPTMLQVESIGDMESENEITTGLEQISLLNETKNIALNTDTHHSAGVAALVKQTNNFLQVETAKPHHDENNRSESTSSSKKIKMVLSSST